MYYVRKIHWKVDEETQTILDEQSRIVTWLYNRLLERANELREIFRETQDLQAGRILYTERGLRDLIPEMKKQYSFLNKAYSTPLRNAAMRLSRAIHDYQASWHGKRPGRKIRWPTFRSQNAKWFSLDYDEGWKGYRLNGCDLSIHLGKGYGEKRIIRGKLVQPLPLRIDEQVRRLRITKHAGQFFAIFTIERAAPKVKDTGAVRVIALDPNHKNLAYGVDLNGQAVEIENLNTIRWLDERIDVLKGRRDRCRGRSKLNTLRNVKGQASPQKNPSRRWKYFNHRLDQAYQLRRDVTKHYLFALANRLCKQYDVIAIGDYAPNEGSGLSKDMRRAMFNQSLIARFKQVTAWVALRSGKRFIEYAEQGTTRTCHACGYVVDGGLEPKIREWDCPQCKKHHLRDENAALNGLVRTLEKLEMPCSGLVPVSITTRWIWRVTPSGVPALPRGVTVQSTI